MLDKPDNIQRQNTNVAYIGLGANLNNPKWQVMSALETINACSNIELVQHSQFYQSHPMGPQPQNKYINAVAQLKTPLTAIKLLDVLQSIENAQGRIRNEERWGPRTLDLDLLLYNNSEINEPRLVVPHYGIRERSFVLIPLAEIAPDLRLPGGVKISELAHQIGQHGIELFC